MDPSSNPDRPQCPSVLILTKDEEVNIADCLTSCLAFSDDVVVLDSLSTDRTVEIAAGFSNVRIIKRAFDTEYRHRDFGLHEISYIHPWLYICDADERIPPTLAAEITRTVNAPIQECVAYRLRYENMFRGKWIRFASGYPVWLTRLVQPSRVRYEVRETNVHPIVDGKIGDLSQHFVHYSFNKGLAHWFRKHNFYSQMEAQAASKVIRDSVGPWLRALFSQDRAVRRRGLKNLSFYMPARSMLRFFYVFIGRAGFLDGMAGFHYAAMISMYEYWIEIKIRESRSDWKTSTDDIVARRLAALPATVSDPADPMIDVLIPTLNEAEHITEVVKNALSIGSVFVLDSGSTDNTQELARQAGATVIEHPFIDYAAQKNWGLDHIPFAAPWVFILDADERITPELREEVLAAVNSKRTTDGYYINRLPIFMGRCIRHGGMYPSWNLRLIRRGTARYEERSVHEHMVCSGPTEYLHGEMLHIRRENLTRYLEKHIRYADMESEEWIKMRQGQSRSAPAMKLFQGRLGWRQWLRRMLLPRLPASPFWRVLYMYILRLGFLDGAAGWRLACLMGCYEYMIVLLWDEKLALLAKGDSRSAGSSKRPAAVEPPKL